MRRIRILLGLWLLAALLHFGGTQLAHAETPKHAVSNVDSIRRFMEKGQGLFVAGQYQRAAEVFEAGFELHPYSAFLFNAGVALEKSGKLTEAIEHFKKYIEVDPKAPDAAEVKKRILRVEQALKDQAEAAKNKGVSSTKSVTPQESTVEEATKSLVIIETEPPGAKLHIMRRVRGESSFSAAGENPDWIDVISTEAPANASLDVGTYHVAVEQFQDFNPGETSFEVLSGHVLQVKVSLSQGKFMGHLRVMSNVEQARVYLDDPTGKQLPWGKTPYGDYISAGEHSLLVTATGYEPVTQSINLARGQQQELRVELKRLPIGGMRIACNVGDVTVMLDGQVVGKVSDTTTALEVRKLNAGKHQLQVLAKGRKPLRAEIEIPRGQILPIRAHLVVLPPRGAAYTQAIIGGVLLGGGIYFGLESNRLYDELKTDHNRGSLASDDSRELRGKIYSISADVAFLGAAALSGIATYNFLRDPLPPSRLVTYRPVEFDSPNRVATGSSRPAMSARESSMPRRYRPTLLSLFAPENSAWVQP